MKRNESVSNKCLVLDLTNSNMRYSQHKVYSVHSQLFLLLFGIHSSYKFDCYQRVGPNTPFLQAAQNLSL